MLRSSARARTDALSDDNVDMYLSVNLRGVKLLDFDAISEIAERGYRATGPPWNASRACERGRARFMVGPGLLGSKYWRETDHTTPQQSVR
jgi:hypothetical protein